MYVVFTGNMRLLLGYTRCFIYIFFCITLSLPLVSNANNCNQESELCVQVTVNSIVNLPLENMVVYLEPLEGQKLGQSNKVIKIDQYQKSFAPYVSVSQTQGQVNFANQDDITHHIYSADNKNKFSFKIRAGETNTTTKFDHSSAIAMGCNIHDWMSGYLLVVNTPYFAKTNNQGQVVFENIEQGKYQLVIWHPQMQAPANKISMEKNITETSHYNITLNSIVEANPQQQNEDDFDFLSEY